jgi:hypothetical protein
MITETKAPVLVEVLPGGDAVFTVRIPEISFSALKAEAEVQKESPAQFLQRNLEFWLDNWLR